MNVTIVLTGTSPLLMHNPQMVDPEFQINREIKALTSKRKKTEDDLRQIERLEWFGGLYVDDAGTVVQPSSKVRKCLINTARISKLGKQVERAVMFSDLYVPLTYHGPRDVKQLFEDKAFHSRLSVGVGNKRVMRVRPKFMPWSLTVSGVFIEDAGLNVDEFTRIVDLAGTVEGIGDGRAIGYGRFTAQAVLS